MVKKKVALLGATGSIGKSTLDVVGEQSDKLEIVLATANRNAVELFLTADKFRIPNLVITDEQAIRAIPPIINNRKIYRGEDELIKVLNELDYDIAINAISGSAGLRSTMSILQRGKTLALANKESLVMAGHLVKELQAKFGSRIIPVDSEHSAIFQALGRHPVTEVAKVHITASGGAFRTLPLKDFGKITVEQALKHPNWDMGAKVTLDSATMFNKALEVMEAHWLFDLDWDQIHAVIHPQSVIHSMVEFVDGSFLAQMSVPDMKLPILYALSYPERYASSLVQTELLQLPALSFSEIDHERYPLFYTGVEAGRAGGIMPTIANAANEAALRLFLDRKIHFTDIASIVAETLAKVKQIEYPDLETIITANTKTYNQVLNNCN